MSQSDAQQTIRRERPQIGNEEIGSTCGQIFQWYDTCADGDRAEAVGAGGGDIIGMIADERDGGVCGNPALFAGFADGQSGEGGAGGPLLGEGAEAEVGAESGAAHFGPADAAEVAGDEAHGDAEGGESGEELGGAGADAFAEVGAAANIKSLGLGDDGGEGLEGIGSLEPGDSKHEHEDVSIEHALDGNAVGGGGPAGDVKYSVFESPTVVGPGAAEQRAVDVEQDEGGGGHGS